MSDVLPACNVCKEPDCKRIPAIVAWHRSGNAKAEGAVLRLETANCHGRKEAAERAAADRISDTEHERDIRGELLNAAQEAVGATWWHGIAPAIRDLESRLAAALEANAKQAAESRAVEMMAQIGALVAEQAEFERDGLHVAAAANLEKLRALKRSQHYGNCWFRGGSREVHSMGGPVRLECDCCSTGDYNAAIDVEIRVLDAPDAAKGGE